MRRDSVITKPVYSTFLNAEKDFERIVKKLFVESRPYSDYLKRLLAIDAKDCLDESIVAYQQKIDTLTPRELIKQKYITMLPLFHFREHEESRSYLNIMFDHYSANNENDLFKDSMIYFDIICHTELWDLGNYQMRPLKIAGYIDGLLDKSHLSGIGEINFVTAIEVNYSNKLSGYTLVYKTVHSGEDKGLIY